ncbi:Gfo/Idh/MocA family protein [Paenibacillus terrae]|uniref:Oxidoreductase n=1 Tax=Paenibacillus terrae (strain HPL-003) TaxID=985665 RepID=G7VPA3_PAETH|nr:Gfo/Idh/MocA family oxidoreductase [Paenibacillus terrae]AET60980.1 oxidoreductase [Paenibacillus terrae HPL-003]
MLLGGEVDLVSICTSTQSHAEITLCYLRAGMHDLLEKPMAMSLEECDQMLEAAKESGSILSVVGQNQYLDAHIRLKER